MWNRGLIVTLVTALYGGWIWVQQETNPIIRYADAEFMEWLGENTPQRAHPPIPVTIVEMENAREWKALDYALFLRAMSKKASTVVVLESLPTFEDNAYYRSFVDSALRQPRLLLPVVLSDENSEIETSDTLVPLNTSGSFQDEPIFKIAKVFPPEELLGLTREGVVNLTNEDASSDLTVPLYFRLGDNAVPSLVLQSILAAWRIPAAEVRVEPGRRIFLESWSHAVSSTGRVSVDPSYLPGMRRVRSSDLLLELEPGTMPTDGKRADLGCLDRGIVLLGDVSDKAKIFQTNAGVSLSRVELMAIAITTICNGSPLADVPLEVELAWIGFWMVVLLLLPQQRPDVRVVILVFSVLAFVWTSLVLARQYSLAMPFFLPVTMVLFGFSLSEMSQRLFKDQADGKN